uniref:Uncharacterized protein n=1 Tax=Panagrolaimus davidi TaxID=227884 RepID=A0A914P5I9_9BILA
MPRNIIVHCQYMPEDSELLFIPVNIRTNQCSVVPIECNANISSQVDTFFQQRFANIIYPNGVKAILFISTENEFKSFATAYYFRQKLRDYCKMHGIFYSFPTQDSLHMFGALLSTKIMVKEGEEILFLRSRANYSTGNFTNVEAMIAVRKKDSYQFIKTLDKIKYGFTQQWKKRFLQSSNPKRVIILCGPHDSNEYVHGMLEVFKDEKAVVYNFGHSLENINEPVVQKVLHDMQENLNPYYVSQMFLYNFQVKVGDKVLIAVTLDRAPPLDESFVVDVDPIKTVTVTQNALNKEFSTKEPNYAIIEKVKLSEFKCKKVKVILKVDINSFYEFKVEPVEYEDKSELSSDKARIIFDKQNFSVCIVKDDKETIITNSNGLDKTPNYIAFTEEKPIVGKAALEMFNEKPDFVVFDLIKLCSITSEDVMNPKWKFTLSKDEDGTIMVTMQTINGERKSSVAFLLAIVFKYALKIAKNENGKKVKNVEIKFVGFEPNETLKKNFIEAGNLMNVKTTFC